MSCHDVSVKPSDYCISTANLDALADFTSFSALGIKPTLLQNVMESLLEAVRQDICSAKDEIVEVKQELAIAKQVGNKGGEEEVRFLPRRLEKLDTQLLSLNEKENILLRSQAPGKQCLELMLACDFILLHSVK